MTNLVVHVDEPAKVATAISNVQNFLAARPTSTVVVVVNGPAITTLATGAWEPLQQTLPQVEIDACHNAMVSHQNCGPTSCQCDGRSRWCGANRGLASCGLRIFTAITPVYRGCGCH